MMLPRALVWGLVIHAAGALSSRPRRTIEAYLTKIETSLKQMALDEKILSNSEIRRGELNILFRLQDKIKRILHRSSDADLGYLLDRGSTCSPDDVSLQDRIKKYIALSLCSEIEWYKLAAFSTPDIHTALDIGSNKGLLSALFLSLWGGHQLGATPKSVAEFEKLYKFSNLAQKTKMGYCGYHANTAYPFDCILRQHRGDDVFCDDAKGPFVLHSVDGSSIIMRMTNAAIAGISQRVSSGSAEPDGSNVLSRHWFHHHLAMSSVEGVANFSLPLSDNETLGFEGGALFSKDAPLDDRLRFELVEVSTIDHFVKRIVERRKQADVSWWLEGKNGFDLIKIDAEGQDREVIFGGLDQIKNHAKIFSFECAPCPIKKTDFEMFEDWGFSCYSLTRAGLVKWTGSCTSASFWSTTMKPMGNVMCVSRPKAPEFALSMDSLSFPSLFESFGDGDAAALKHKLSTEDGLKSIAKDALINWKRFCTPWPSCITKNI